MNALILADNRYLAEQMVLCLKERRARVTIIGTEHCAGLNSDRHCDWFVPLDQRRFNEAPETVLDVINEVCKRWRFDVILPAGTVSTFFMAEFGDKVVGPKPIPQSYPALLRRLSDKAEFRRLMERLAIPHPRTHQIDCPAQLDLPMLAAPIVIKPAVGEGGIGVEIIRSEKQLEEALPRLRAEGSFPLLVQEYIPGEDIDLSALVDRGKVVAWTIQRKTETWEVQFTTNQEVLDLGRRIFEHTGYTGIAHVDMRLDERDGSIKVIEFNTRFWFSVLASAKAGVNFVDLAVRMATEQPLPKIEYKEVRFALSRDYTWR